MTFEAFIRRGPQAAPVKHPRLRVAHTSKNSVYGRLNKAAIRSLQSPERVALLWSSSPRAIGIRSSSTDDPYSYALGGNQTFSLGAMFRFYEIQLDLPAELDGELQGDVLVFPLEAKI